MSKATQQHLIISDRLTSTKQHSLFCTTLHHRRNASHLPQTHDYALHPAMTVPCATALTCLCMRGASSATSPILPSGGTTQHGKDGRKGASPKITATESRVCRLPGLGSDVPWGTLCLWRGWYGNSRVVYVSDDGLVFLRRSWWCCIGFETRITRVSNQQKGEVQDAPRHTTPRPSLSLVSVSRPEYL
ncbi:hypothetical protein BU25DRAFT_198864 [Macroventuria anomochaeta]|uniref:Uncharacterized protein n=1 Tax=Macroventuria anomochaeta TaxID=301207 RepID=A0ACB6RMC6_9PLEO|nr:uncharacterized protein BU25DRAFT_198864 [Macroventuria anomochaeta]KAF2622953.1 hypothetical protein BU25DRAFT_198864 [Macroventuria anomochaeta]